MTEPIIELREVSRSFVKRLDLAEKLANRLGAGIREQTVQAVDRVSLSINEGEVLGLVGESGCGKSTLGRVIAGLLEATGGSVLYRGADRANLERERAREVALGIQMIFQDPFSSLNPRMRVGNIIGEAPEFHGLVPARALDDHVDDLMMQVGLDPAYKRRFPHQFSGGQRQRIGIARALAVNPEFLVCDEAVARAGRVHPGADSESAHAVAHGPGSHLSVHQPRSRRGRAPLGSRRHHVSGTYRRKRTDGIVVCSAEPPVYAGAAE